LSDHHAVPTEPSAVADRLREAGLRATRPRILVYQVLREVGGHLSVDDVVTLLQDRSQRIPRMTVYNVVSDLSSAGLVMRADTGPGRAIYEAGDKWHHHFVCRRCGRVIDVPCVIGAKPCLEQDVPGVSVVDEAQIIFRSVCEACDE